RKQAIGFLVLGAAATISAVTIPGFPVVYWRPDLVVLTPLGQMLRLSWLALPVLTGVEASINLTCPRLTWHRPMLTVAPAAWVSIPLIFAGSGSLVQFADRTQAAIAAAGVDSTPIAAFINSVIFDCFLLAFCLALPSYVSALFQFLVRRSGRGPIPVPSST